MIEPSVPTRWMSSEPGSSLVGDALGRQHQLAPVGDGLLEGGLIDFWRPTKSGTTIVGNTMMSRSGRSGRGATLVASRFRTGRQVSSFSFRNMSHAALLRGSGGPTG